MKKILYSTVFFAIFMFSASESVYAATVVTCYTTCSPVYGNYIGTVILDLQCTAGSPVNYIGSLTVNGVQISYAKSCPPPPPPPPSQPSCAMSFGPNPLSIGSVGSFTLSMANDSDGVALCSCFGGLDATGAMSNLIAKSYSQGPFYTSGAKSCTCTVSNSTGSKSCGAILTVPAPTTYSCPALPLSHTTYHSGDTTSLTGPTGATYSSSNTAPKCQYYCVSGYSWNGSSCVVTTYSCPALPLSHTTYHSGDTTSLTGPTGATYSSSNTAPKCQYYCVSGYSWNGSSCVAITEPTVTLTTNPSVTAGVGQSVRWFATPEDGVPPYGPYVWSGDISSTTVNNWIDLRIAVPSTVSIQVDVQDSIGQPATDSATIEIVENRDPQ